MSAGVRYHISGPEADAVAHVLTAARECQAKWSTWSRPHMPPECRRLMDAIEDLDAPQPRWRVAHVPYANSSLPWAVLDGEEPTKGEAYAYSMSEEKANLIRDALNAAEQP